MNFSSPKKISLCFPDAYRLPLTFKRVGISNTVLRKFIFCFLTDDNEFNSSFDIVGGVVFWLFNRRPKQAQSQTCSSYALQEGGKRAKRS
ncbi:MAG: hypothetical protein RRY39_06365 [Odoribacter sp.]